MIPPTPQNEEQRIENLYSYSILDTGNDADFDNIIHLASFICDTPISLISLVDKKRQWFKANKGLTVNETSRDVSFCAFAILNTNEPLIIEDATCDERFANNALVTDSPQIRFYAGYPLVSAEGYGLGTLCVIDTKPRKLSVEQIMAIQFLAKKIVNLFELKKTLAEKQAVINQLTSITQEKIQQCRYPLEQIQFHTNFISENIDEFDFNNTPTHLKLIQHNVYEVAKVLNTLSAYK